MTTKTQTPTVHLIGNAHLDPVWLWRWQEGCAEAIGTCWAAIDRLEEGEGFIFTKGEAHIYKWIEELAPDLFERIKYFVAENRWIIVNGWWIQPDCNVPSGESVIRQALYGKRYFKEKFGVDVPVGYNVDSFGHPATFPMLLRHTGSDTYTFMRPGPHEMDLPGELFDWVSPDGSSVTAFRIQNAYNTSKREMPLPEKIDLHAKLGQDRGHDFMCFYGVGNHGGAPTIENIKEIDRRLNLGENIKFSDPQTFFKEVADLDRPKVESALQFHAIGCYSVASSLKTLNRKAESILEQAEAAAALAMKETGAAYPQEKFAELWQTLLFNQFHDTLGGTSLKSACVDSERELAGIIADAEKLLNAAVRHLDGAISPSTHPEDATFIVMNFSGQAFTGLVEAEPWVDKDNVSKRILVDEQGEEIAFQYADPHGKTTGLQRICFPLNVDAFGYRTLRFTVDESGQSAPPVSFGKPADSLHFETAAYRLELDKQTGGIASLVNKQNGLDMFNDTGHLGMIVDDPTDTWSHGIDRFGFEGETFDLHAVSLIEEGPVRTVVKVTSRAGNSSLATHIILPTDPAQPVELRVQLDWRESQKLLRLAYPVGAEHFEFETPAGWDNAPENAGRETPGLRWARGVGEGRQTVIANDAKYSYAASNGTLYVTAVRSPVYAHHIPIELEGGAHYDVMDQGLQEFSIQLQTQVEVTRKEANRMADQVNKPLVTTPHVSRNGDRPHNGQWLAATAVHGHVSTLKKHEDSDGLILRVLELDGLETHVEVAGTSTTISPRSINTLLIEDGEVTPISGLEFTTKG